MDANGQCIILANINEFYLFDDIFSFCNPSLSNCIGETKIGRCGQVEPTFCTMPCITRLYGLHIVAVYIIIIFIRIYIYILFSCLTSAGAAGNFRVKCAKEKCPSVASWGRPSYQIGSGATELRPPPGGRPESQVPWRPIALVNLDSPGCFLETMRTVKSTEDSRCGVHGEATSKGTWCLCVHAVGW